MKTKTQKQGRVKLTAKDLTNNTDRQIRIIRKTFKDCMKKLKHSKEDQDFLIIFDSSIGLYETRRLTEICDKYDFNFSVQDELTVLMWHSPTLYNSIQ